MIMANMVQVKQLKSLIGRPEKHRRIVYGLGLRRVNQVRSIVDTPSVRGMVRKVEHLVCIVD